MADVNAEDVKTEPEKPGADKAEKLTQHGYPLDEAASALQVAIRRGWEREALFWALELLEGKFADALWAALMLATVEDVGMAAPWMPTLISVLEDAWRRLHKGNQLSASYYVAHAVMCLCRAPKNHEVQNYLLYMRGSVAQKGLRYDVPDAALGPNTRRGRELDRGGAFWLGRTNLLAQRRGGNVYRSGPEDLLSCDGAIPWKGCKGVLPDETEHEEEAGWFRGEQVAADDDVPAGDL